MRLLIYEDQHWRRLRPLTDLLPVPALTFGASGLARRWIAAAALPLAAIEARAGVWPAGTRGARWTRARSPRMSR